MYLEPHEISAIANGVAAREEWAEIRLYEVITHRAGKRFAEEFGRQDLQDKVHDVWIVTVSALRKSALADPTALLGFIKTVLHRSAFAYIQDAIGYRRNFISMEDAGINYDMNVDRGGNGPQNRLYHHVPEKSHMSDKKPNPEQIMQSAQRRELVHKALSELSPREQEILMRFYVDEQPEPEIREAMQLTPTQFRLRKSRTKAKFGEIGKQLQQSPMALRAAA